MKTDLLLAALVALTTLLLLGGHILYSPPEDEFVNPNALCCEPHQHAEGYWLHQAVEGLGVLL